MIIPIPVLTCTRSTQLRVTHRRRRKAASLKEARGRWQNKRDTVPSTQAIDATHTTQRRSPERGITSPTITAKSIRTNSTSLRSFTKARRSGIHTPNPLRATTPKCRQRAQRASTPKCREAAHRASTPKCREPAQHASTPKCREPAPRTSTTCRAPPPTATTRRNKQTRSSENVNRRTK